MDREQQGARIEPEGSACIKVIIPILLLSLIAFFIHHVASISFLKTLLWVLVPYASYNSLRSLQERKRTSLTAREDAVTLKPTGEAIEDERERESDMNTDENVPPELAVQDDRPSNFQGFWDVETPPGKRNRADYDSSSEEEVHERSRRTKKALRVSNEQNNFDNSMESDRVSKDVTLNNIFSDDYRVNKESMVYTKDLNVFADTVNDDKAARDYQLVARRVGGFSSSDESCSETETAPSEQSALLAAMSAYKVNTLTFDDQGVLINNIVYLPKVKWNTLVLNQVVNGKVIYLCAVCSDSFRLVEASRHMDLERHKKKLDECPPLGEFGDNLIRRVNKSQLHCAICNVIKGDMRDHVSDMYHKVQYNWAIDCAKTFPNDSTTGNSDFARAVEKPNKTRERDNLNASNDNGTRTTNTPNTVANNPFTFPPPSNPTFQTPHQPMSSQVNSSFNTTPYFNFNSYNHLNAAAATPNPLTAFFAGLPPQVYSPPTAPNIAQNAFTNTLMTGVRLTAHNSFAGSYNTGAPGFINPGVAPPIRPLMAPPPGMGGLGVYAPFTTSFNAAIGSSNHTAYNGNSWPVGTNYTGANGNSVEKHVNASSLNTRTQSPFINTAHPSPHSTGSAPSPISTAYSTGSPSPIHTPFISPLNTSSTPSPVNTVFGKFGSKQTANNVINGTNFTANNTNTNKLSTQMNASNSNINKLNTELNGSRNIDRFGGELKSSSSNSRLVTELQSSSSNINRPTTELKYNSSNNRPTTELQSSSSNINRPTIELQSTGSNNKLATELQSTISNNRLTTELQSFNQSFKLQSTGSNNRLATELQSTSSNNRLTTELQSVSSNNRLPTELQPSSSNNRLVTELQSSSSSINTLGTELHSSNSSINRLGTEFKSSSTNINRLGTELQTRSSNINRPGTELKSSGINNKLNTDMIANINCNTSISANTSIDTDTNVNDDSTEDAYISSSETKFKADDFFAKATTMDLFPSIFNTPQARPTPREVPQHQHAQGHTAGPSVFDFPPLPKSKHSESEVAGFSYAQMASKNEVAPKKPKGDPKKIVVTIKNRKFILKSDHFHCIMPFLDCHYCMVCMNTLPSNMKSDHKASLTHRSKMSRSPLIEEQGERMIRRLDDNFSHCSICNQIIPEHQIDNHCLTDNHVQWTKDVMSESTDKNIKNQEEYDHAISHQLETVGSQYDIEPTFTMDTRPIDIELLLNVFNSDMKISMYSWNGLVGYKGCFRCIFCSDTLQPLMVQPHIERSDHQGNVQRFPFLPQHGTNLIRALSKKWIHCGICNNLITSDEYTVHVNKDFHINKRKKAADPTTPRPLSRVPVSNVTVQKPKPEPTPAPAAAVKSASAKVSKQTPSAVKAVAAKAEKKRLLSASSVDHHEEMNDKQTPYLITHRRRSVLLNSNSWHGIRATRPGNYYCSLCQTTVGGDAEDHKATMSHNTEMMASQMMDTKGGDFVRELTAEVVQCLTCNEVLGRGNLDMHTADVQHISLFKAAQKHAGKPPDNAEIIDFDEFTDETDPHDKLYLIKQKKESDSLVVGYFAWHGLQHQGNILRCLLCGAAVSEQPEVHVGGVEHAENMTNNYLSDKYPGNVLRILKKNSHHCMTCDSVLQIQQVENHIKKPTHLKLLNDAKQAVCQPNLSAEIIIFSEHIKPEEPQNPIKSAPTKKIKKPEPIEPVVPAAVKNTEEVKDELQEIMKEKKNKEIKPKKKKEVEKPTKKKGKAKEVKKLAETAQEKIKEEKKSVLVELPGSSKVTATCRVIVPMEGTDETMKSVEDLQGVLGNNTTIKNSTGVNVPGLLIEVGENAEEKPNSEVEIKFETDETVIDVPDIHRRRRNHSHNSTPDVEGKQETDTAKVAEFTNDNASKELEKDIQNDKPMTKDIVLLDLGKDVGNTDTAVTISAKPEETKNEIVVNTAESQSSVASENQSKYKLFSVKTSESNKDLLPTALFLDVSPDKILCVSCGDTIQNSGISEHVKTAEHSRRSSVNLSCNVDIPASARRGSVQKVEVDKVEMILIRNSKLSLSVLVSSDAWHGLTELKDGVYCNLCSVELSLSEVEKHKVSKEHRPKLKVFRLSDSHPGHIFRVLSAGMMQCLTCNQVLNARNATKHASKSKHTHQMEEATNITNEGHKLQTVNFADYVEEISHEPKVKGATLEVKPSVALTEEQKSIFNNLSIIADANVLRDTHSRCVLCNITIANNLIDSHVRSKSHATQVRAVVDHTLANRSVSSAILLAKIV